MKRILYILSIALATLLSCNNEVDKPINWGDKPEVKDTTGTHSKDTIPPAPSKKTINILAIGNSFSDDATNYLYQILQEAGYEEIHIGNLYIGGCTLQTHATNFTGQLGKYIYRTNDSGTWSSTEATYVGNQALKLREWDIITMQQASGSSGVQSTYEPYLSTLIRIVKEQCPKAKLYWHMTWAYQGNSTHSSFPTYGSDQMKMYTMIVDAVKACVFNHREFDGIIPCGTAIQNLRTSHIGDVVTRDGYHMSYREGRFTTALMWAKVLGGADIEKITFKPNGYSYSEKDIAAIKESVENAFTKPYEVTKSQYAPADGPVDESTLSCDQLLERAGYKLSDYNKTALTITHNAYYNSSNKTYVSGIISAATGSSATNLNQFACTQMFGKSDIPEGSIIVLRVGYQYRPEGWTSLSAANASSARPANVTTKVTVVDSAWWGSWNHRAFNLAKLGNPALDAAGQSDLDTCFAIYTKK